MKIVPRPLTLELLEARDCPSTYGLAWPDAHHLTLSFAPDGTSVAGTPSNLFAEMNLLMPTAAWQGTILRAFQTWASVANIDVSVVPDGGQPFGGPGAVQGDPRFGDLRIGAGPVSAQDLAMTAPFDLGDTWSGDVVFSNLTAGLLAPLELYNVALHEAGHALGLPASPDPLSIMYPTYLGQGVSGLSAGDVANIRALYGPRQPDAFEAGAGNNTLATAAAAPFGPAFDADLSSAGEADFFKVTAPAAGGFQVALRTSGLSLTTARVTVYDAGQNVVATAVAADPQHGDLTLTVPSAAAGAAYFVEVQGANNDVFGVGAYRLAVGPSAAAFIASTPTAPTWTDAGHNSPGTALALATTYGVADDHVDHSLRAVLTSAGQTDFYRLTAPQANGGAPEALLAEVYGLGGSAPAPTATVYDANGNAVAAQVLKNDAGGYVVQVASVTPGAAYYVKVAAGPNGAAAGTYQLALDFRRPVSLYPNTYAGGQLSALTPTGLSTLTVTQGRLFRFDLQMTGPATAVDAVIYDALGDVVLRLHAANGQGGVGGVWLNPGVYTIRVSVSGAGLSAVSYTLTGDTRNDHDGLDPIDTTSTPTQPSQDTSPPQSSPPPQQQQPTYYPESQPSSQQTTDGSSSSDSPPPDDPYSQPYWQ
jgi:hypothetical protein